jgi:signal peptidase I
MKETSMKTETRPTVPREQPQSEPATPGQRQKAALRDLIEMIVLVAVIFLGIRLTVEFHPVDGPSMQPNFTTGQYIYTNKLAYLFGTPQRGDVVIFHPPTNPSDVYIKRIIGLPGDTITITPTTVAVNGYVLHETYISAADNCSVMVDAGLVTNRAQCQPRVIHLGANQYWVMGDNRPVSDDSRIFGPIGMQNIIGKASFVLWPLSAFHGIDMHHAVFAHVPPPAHAVSSHAPAPGNPLALAPLPLLRRRMA